MTYKTISTFLHDVNAPEAALEMAISAAREWDAHLHVICGGIDFTDPGYYNVGASLPNLQINLENAQTEAKALKKRAIERLAREEIAYDIQTVTIVQHGLDEFLTNQLRFSDLVFLQRPYNESKNHTDVKIFEACLFSAKRPVMVVPPNWTGSARFNNAMIAWDDGAQALLACRAAIPILQTVPRTEICIIDPPKHGEGRSDPGGRLAQYLAHFNVRPDINVMALTQPKVANQLGQRTQEQGTELLVMGAYGHSRLRQAIIGGVTRHFLETAEMPVLMAH